MARNNPGAAWARMFGRIAAKATRRQLRAGQRLVTQALVQAAKPAKPVKTPKPPKLPKPPKPPKLAKPSKVARPRAPSPTLKPGAVPAQRRPAKPAPAPAAPFTAVGTLRLSSRQRLALAADGDWLPGVVIAGGSSRRYRLYRPPGLAPGERLPLLVMLHGCGQDAAGFAASTRMNRLAARERFLVLYPEQDRLANPQGCWNWFDTRRGRAQAEAELVLQAVDQAVARHQADGDRVALMGFSAGAGLAALLAMRHPGRFKALVMHSGVPPGSANSTKSALGAMQGRRSAMAGIAGAGSEADGDAALPPLLVVHGSADRVVSFDNARQAAALWADAGGASAAAPRNVQRGQRHAMTVTDHRRGRRLVATLAEVAGLGHAWSGGAASMPFSDAQGPDASRLAWAFAARAFAR